MAKIKFEQGFEIERKESGEYILRFKTPQVKLDSDLTGGHLKEAKNEILMAARSLIDKAISSDKEEDKEQDR